jgi:hypothetical protein
MTSFLDIAPSTATVEVCGQSVHVPGISALGLAALFRRFPEILTLFQGGAIAAATDLFELAPVAVSAILAAGLGHVGDHKIEEHAAKFPVGTQLEIILAIFGATFPRGVEDFIEALNRAGERVGAATKSQ